MLTTHIPDPPVVFPFPKEHPELSLLLNHDLQLGERRRDRKIKGCYSDMNQQRSGLSQKRSRRKTSSVKGLSSPKNKEHCIIIYSHM